MHFVEFLSRSVFAMPSSQNSCSRCFVKLKNEEYPQPPPPNPIYRSLLHTKTNFNKKKKKKKLLIINCLGSLSYNIVISSDSHVEYVGCYYSVFYYRTCHLSFPKVLCCSLILLYPNPCFKKNIRSIVNRRHVFFHLLIFILCLFGAFRLCVFAVS